MATLCGFKSRPRYHPLFKGTPHKAYRSRCHRHIGTEATTLLKKRHDVISVSHISGDDQCDTADESQVQPLFPDIGLFGAVVATVGKVPFGAHEEFTTAN